MLTWLSTIDIDENGTFNENVYHCCMQVLYRYIAQNIDVQYSMNLTNTAPDQLSCLDILETFNWCYSIDAYGQLNDYNHRYPSHGELLKKTYKNFYNYPIQEVLCQWFIIF